MSKLKDWLMGKALNTMLWRKSRPSLVRRALAGRDFPRAPRPTGDTVRVGVVQLELHFITSAAGYAEKMYELSRQAVEGGAQLVIFPEDTGTHLLGLLPGVEELAEGTSMDEAIAQVAGPDIQVADVFKAVAPGARRIYEATFSTLAQGFGVHIVAGSILLPDKRGDLYNVGYFYGPDGRLIGTQKKTHLFIIEQEWGLACHDEIQVFDTPLGVIAFPICMDHTFFEPIRVAWLQGAEVIIDPSANPAPYDYWEQMRGVWGRVQESPAYGILCCMVGDLAGFTFQGRSGVYAPLEMTPNGDGIIAQAETVDREEILLADLDLAALRRFRQEQKPDFNLALYEKYLPRVYEAYRRMEVEGRRVVVHTQGSGEL
ncbi:MAG: nitrilase [Anaerolineae bacterium]|nr:nitrilase [Anaerolineae bacterium]